MKDHTEKHTNSSNGGYERIALVSEGKIGGRARTGAIWSVAQIIVRNGLSLVVTAILARILLPEDYGLVGMVATMAALLQVFLDMGLSWATVRSRHLNLLQVSGLFWINLTVGLIAWGVMAAASPLVSEFFDEPELKMIAIVSGASFLLSGLAVQPMALLTRAMEFRRISIIEVVSLCIGAVAAITLALSGAGYWALVVQVPVQTLVRLSLAIRPSGLRIFAPRWTPGLSAMVRFGGLLVLSGFLIFLTRNLDGILVGKVWGAQELGYYNRAYFLMLLPSTLASGILSHVMVSSLSSLQHDRERLASAYRRALGLVAYLGVPMALGLALTASSAVPLVYGPGWDRVVVLLTWLSLAGITQPIYNTSGWLFTSSGRADLYAWVTLSNTVILGAVFALTVNHGTAALAQGYGITMGLILPLPVLFLAHRAADIPLLPSLKILMPIALINLVMGIVILFVGAGAKSLELHKYHVFFAQVLAGLVVYSVLTPLLLPQLLSRDLAPLLTKLKFGKDPNQS